MEGSCARRMVAGVGQPRCRLGTKSKVLAFEAKASGTSCARARPVIRPTMGSREVFRTTCNCVPVAGAKLKAKTTELPSAVQPLAATGTSGAEL